jgi:hypothetical protein
MSRAAWVQRALPDGSAINDSFARQGWPFLPETNMQTLKQRRVLRRDNELLRVILDSEDAKALATPEHKKDELAEQECNAPRTIPHAWQHLD